MEKHYPFRVRPVRRLALGVTLGLLMAVSAPAASGGGRTDAVAVGTEQELLSVREVLGWIEKNSRYVIIYRTDVDLDRQVDVRILLQLRPEIAVASVLRAFSVHASIIQFLQPKSCVFTLI